MTQFMYLCIVHVAYKVKSKHKLVQGKKAKVDKPNFSLMEIYLCINPNRPDGVSGRHTLQLIASHFYMNEANEVSFYEFLS